LTILSEPVSPALESYVQTEKTLSGQTGSPNWYTTKNDVSEGAIRTAVTAYLLSIGVEQRREAPINITSLLQMYQPTRVIIKEISCASKWSGTGLISSDVTLSIKNSNKEVLYLLDIASGQDSYQQNYASPNLDVTGQPEFLLEVYHGVRAEAGGNDVKTRYMAVTFELETATTTYDVSVRLQDEQGNLMYGAHARVGSITYSFPNGEGVIQLPQGTYNLEAWAYIEERTYRGNGVFTVPEDPQVTVTMKPESWLPDWWWIIPVGVGGLVTVYIVYKLIKGEKPSFIVVR
jgi:hypothetical protein